MISQKLLNELKKILKEDYSIELNQTELEEVAIVLVKYFDLSSKILTYRTKR